MAVTVPRLHRYSRTPGSFYNYFRVDEQLFDLLLSKVTPHIQRRDTQFRQAIPPRSRLAVTLRFLATGNSFTDLHYQFRMGESIESMLKLEVLMVSIPYLNVGCVLMQFF